MMYMISKIHQQRSIFLKTKIEFQPIILLHNPSYCNLALYSLGNIQCVEFIQIELVIQCYSQDEFK